MPNARRIDPERAARLRAARSYSGRDHKSLGAELGISATTLSRIENAKTAIEETQALAFVDACGVPRWFLEHGFEAPPVPEEPTLMERVEALEQQVATLLRQLAADGPAPPPSGLLQQPEDHQPKPGTGQGEKSARARGAR